MINDTKEYLELKKQAEQSLKPYVLDFMADGGNIYGIVKQLPYYNRLRRILEKGKKLDPNFDHKDIYEMLGIGFDMEYYLYREFLEVAKLSADKDGFIDDIRTISGEHTPKARLQRLCKTLNCSPSDYLILMTPYRYHRAIISADYVDELRYELLKTFPEGDVTHIKRKNNKLYEKIRHLQKYAPENVSIPDLISFFELSGSDFKDLDTEKEKKLDIKEYTVIELIQEGIKSQSIYDFFKSNRRIYFHAIECARRNNQTLEQFLKSHNIEYQGQSISRLSKYEVDPIERENELLSTKDEIEEQMGGVMSPNPIEEYYRQKWLADKTLRTVAKRHQDFVK